MREILAYLVVLAFVAVFAPLLAMKIAMQNAPRGPWDCRSGYNISGCWENAR
jgi:hypothetical protein